MATKEVDNREAPVGAGAFVHIALCEVYKIFRATDGILIFSVVSRDQLTSSKSGKKWEHLEWTTIRVFKPQGFKLTEGDRLQIDGKLRTESFTDKKTNQKIYRTGVVAVQVVAFDVDDKRTIVFEETI